MNETVQADLLANEKRLTDKQTCTPGQSDKRGTKKMYYYDCKFISEKVVRSI